MTRSFTAAEISDIVTMKAQGRSIAQIGKALGAHPTDISRATPPELKRKRRSKGASQITTIPLGSAPDSRLPAVSIQLSHEEFARLGQNPVVVAGMMQAEKEASDSLRTRILSAVCRSGPFADVLTLMKDLRRPGDPRDNFGAHEVTHIIKSLNKQGLVTYVEASTGSVVIPTKITATRQGASAAGLPTYNREIGRQRNGAPQRKGDRTDFRTHTARATGGEVLREPLAPDHLRHFPEHADKHQAPEPSTPVERPEKAALAAPPVARQTPVQGPLLTELRARFAQNAEADEKASKYAEAAASLEAIDPKRSEELLALALEVGGKPFTALEIEFLRYVAEAEGE